ncbi:MAG TPA: ribosome-associated translation inhibitor RaiA [Acidimicrobiia bacterium]|jgi:ribosomal subunit interface protein
MNVIVRGKNVSVPSTLRMAAQRKLGRLERVARDASRAEVDFSEERNPRIRQRHRCAVVVHRPYELLTAHAAAPDPEAALDLVVDKLRHQAAQHKDR